MLRSTLACACVGITVALLGCSKSTSPVGTATPDAASAQAPVDTCTLAGRYAVAYKDPQGSCGEVLAQTFTVTGAGASAKMVLEGGQLEGGGAVFDPAGCQVDFYVTVQNQVACGATQRTLRVRATFGKAGLEGKASTSGSCKAANCTGSYTVVGVRQ